MKRSTRTFLYKPIDQCNYRSRSYLYTGWLSPTALILSHRLLVHSFNFFSSSFRFYSRMRVFVHILARDHKSIVDHCPSFFLLFIWLLSLKFEEKKKRKNIDKIWTTTHKILQDEKYVDATGESKQQHTHSSLTQQ